MSKLFIKHVDIHKQYAQCKQFLEAGNIDIAIDCKNLLKWYWESLNDGQVDVADIDLLYRKLKQCIRMIDQAEAQEYDRMRDIKRRMKSGSAALFHYDTY